ncbi:isomerase [Scenedesmus sp. NREL 46B-D3]|nr:isomerase [Scenedesmus sp. NREL 46B-D3]
MLARPARCIASQRHAAFSRRAVVVKCEVKKVVVSGAGGRTGQLVVKKLLEQKDNFSVVATVRAKGSAGKLTSAGLPVSSLVEFDLAAAAGTAGSASNAAAAGLAAALQGADALVIATSGVPQIKYLSLIPVMLAKITGKEGVRPEFSWKQGQNPQQIDWLGQKVQIDAAKAAGVKQVVLISSMGGTDPDHPLNKLGDGNILQWKRKAEQYLIASGIPYTIIHPGGLIDEAGGSRKLILGVDDKLLENNPRNIPRADVAALAVGCIGLKEAMNKSFDAICAPAGQGSFSSSWAEVVGQLAGASCNYSVNSQWADAELAAAAAK